MEVLLLLIPLSVLLALAFGALFWWSVGSGQFDDLDGPAHRILADDDTSDAIPAALPERTGHAAQPRALTTVKPSPGGAGNITLFHEGNHLGPATDARRAGQPGRGPGQR